MLQYHLVDQPEKFFSELGDLHDARISNIRWSFLEKQLIISVDDINSNFLGLPEYDGLIPVNILLSNVTKVEFNITQENDSLWVHELVTVVNCQGIQVEIALCSNGKLSIYCTSIRIEYFGA